MTNARRMNLLNKAREFFGFGRTRCKPGDLAFYVGFRRDMHGRIVRVVKEIPNPEICADGKPAAPGRWWLVEPTVTDRLDKCADSALRPIHGDGITDEEVSSLYQSIPTKETA